MESNFFNDKEFIHAGSMYTGSVENRSSEGNGITEGDGIFGVVMVFKAFLLQEVVQVLEKVVVGGREIRSGHGGFFWKLQNDWRKADWRTPQKEIFLFLFNSCGTHLSSFSDFLSSFRRLGT